MDLNQLLVDQFIGDLNFISRERLDPLIYLILKGKSLPSSLNYRLGQGLIYLLGLIFLSQSTTSGSGKLFRLLGASTVFCLTLAIFGVRFFEAHVQWFPWFAIASVCFVKKNGVSTGLALLATGLIWVLTAGPLAGFGIVAILALGLFIRIDKAGWLLLITGFLFLIGVFYLPQYSFPDYPRSARLVPASIFDLRHISLVGADPRPNMLLAAQYFFELRVIALLMAVAMGILTLFSDKNRKKYLIPGFCLVVLVLIEVALERRGIYHSPSYFLVQLIPGMSLASLFWRPLIPLTALSLVYACFSANQKNLVYISAISILFLVARFLPIEALNDYVIENRSIYQKSSETDVDGLLFSPSNHVASKLGAWTLLSGEGRRRSAEELERIFENPSEPWGLKAGEGEEDVSLLSDLKTPSWWRAVGADSSTRWFEIEFSRPQNITRVVLFLGGLIYEYPRGLEIEYTLARNGQTIVDRRYTPWQGPAKWTQNGYPYFGSNDEVFLDFPQEVVVTKLLFRQTVVDPSVPWSVSEVKLYRAKVEDDYS